MNRFPFQIRWLSPSGVSVQRPDGIIEELPIRESTRRILIGVLLGILGTGIVLLSGQRQKLLRQTSR